VFALAKWDLPTRAGVQPAWALGLQLAREKLTLSGFVPQLSLSAVLRLD
jgi:hypothetical protein